MKMKIGIIAVAAVFMFSMVLCGSAFRQDAAAAGSKAAAESIVPAGDSGSETEETAPFEEGSDPVTMPPDESTGDSSDPDGTDPTDWTDPTDYTDITVTIEEPTDDWTKPEETSDGEITPDPTEDGSYTYTADYDGSENGEAGAYDGETLYKGIEIPQTGASTAGGIAVFAALSLAAAAAFVCVKKR